MAHQKNNKLAAVLRGSLMSTLILICAVCAVAQAPKVFGFGGYNGDQTALVGGMDDVTLTLVNRTSVPVSYFWVDNNGKETLYGTINPGNSTRQGTYAGHWWRFKFGNGAIVGAFAATNRTTQMVEIVSGPINAGPIWNQQDAIDKCNRIASSRGGAWTGGWWTTVQGQMSVCEIANLRFPPPPPTNVNLNIRNMTKSQVRDYNMSNGASLMGTIGVNGSIWRRPIPGNRWRFVLDNGTVVGDYVVSQSGMQEVRVISGPVNAGPIWNQQDAVEKCNRLARARNAVWTGGWWTTVQGQMSVCELAQLNY